MKKRILLSLLIIFIVQVCFISFTPLEKNLNTDTATQVESNDISEIEGAKAITTMSNSAVVAIKGLEIIPAETEVKSNDMRGQERKIEPVPKTESQETESQETESQETESVVEEGPMVAFTFDDGPYNQTTPRILDVLKAYNARATFFIVGQMVERNQEVLIREVEEGHEIGNHSWSHKFLNRMTPMEIQDDFKWTQEIVQNIVEIEPELLRPPYGSYNEKVKQNIPLPLCLWSIDTLDWKLRDKDKIIEKIMESIKDGDIILLHDIHEPTVQAIEEIIPVLSEQGYRFVTVSELLQDRGIEKEAGQVIFDVYKE